MKISVHNQDPIQVQRAPRYGREGIIRGIIEFDEENLATFEKVKLVVRLLAVYPAVTQVESTIGLLSSRGKRLSAAAFMKAARKVSFGRASHFGVS